MLRVDFCRTPAALAVIGFGEVRQFEVNRESFCDPVSLLDAQVFDDGASLFHLAIVELGVAGGVYACLDQQAAKLLNFLKNSRPCLFAQNPPKEGSEGAHVAAQGMFFAA